MFIENDWDFRPDWDLSHIFSLCGLITHSNDIRLDSYKKI